MTIELRPATVFADVAALLGPKRPDANVCWCLSYRLGSKQQRALRGTERGEKVAELVASGPPGVLAYDGDQVVGWAAVHPRADTSFATSRTIPHVDDADAWSVWCLRVRPGHRRQGISHKLLAGAVDFARQSGAPVVEGYPVDNQGQKVDLTMAYVGTRRLFETAGFAKAADTTSVLDGFPRVLMRLNLANGDARGMVSHGSSANMARPGRPVRTFSPEQGPSTAQVSVARALPGVTAAPDADNAVLRRSPSCQGSTRTPGTAT